MSAVPDEAAVRDALRQVVDPEAGLNVVDLGLVYRIDVAEGLVQVDLTMTTAACPMADLIVDQAHDAIAGAVPSGTTIELQLVWEPPWTPERMSDLARDQFGWQAR
jgi:metal-sulfur cluster biosynthetic enzyme